MKRASLAIVLVGILFISMPSTNATERKPLTPKEEEIARKMMMLKEAMPPESRDVIKSQIGPMLHAVTTKKFTCPTSEELQHGVPPKGIYSFYTFENNGIHFTAHGGNTPRIPPVNAKFFKVQIGYKDDGPEVLVDLIQCQYDNGTYSVFFDWRQHKDSQITVNRNDLQFGTPTEFPGKQKKLAFYKNIEFTLQSKK